MRDAIASQVNNPRTFHSAAPHDELTILIVQRIAGEGVSWAGDTPHDLAQRLHPRPQMRFDVSIAPESIDEVPHLAQAAEALGFDTIWTSETKRSFKRPGG